MKTSSRTIITDCQLLQTNDRYRGMGLYLVGLLQSLNENKPPNINFIFLINNGLRNLTPEDETLLHELGDIKKVKLLTKHNHSLFADAAEKNRKVIDKIVSTYPETAVFFIPALFSSEIYPVFPTSGKHKLLLFYDIIPFLYADQYFQDPDGYPRKDYAQRWREAYKTDLFVTISQTTADDLTIYFGIDPSRTVPILGAGAHNSNMPSPSKPSIKGLSNDFVLMPSGDDFRKNNELAVRAFAELNTKTQLVITSNFSNETKRQLQNIVPNLIFSGSVSSSEIIWLIDHARFVFFPSLYEGLGMPILEAVNRGVTIACSDIPVFKELSTEAFSYFNPRSQSSISETLSNLLKNNVKSSKKDQAYVAIQSKFSWGKTAKRFLDSIAQIKPAGERKKLAVFCPSPSSYSAVGKFVFAVHGELSRYFDIDYYYENGQTEFKSTRPNILDGATSYRPVSEFMFDKNDYDYVLYHIGNSEFHAETILSSLRFSANAIIHDSWLDGIFDYMERYKYLTPDRKRLESIIDSKLKTKRSQYLSSIASNQKAIFCHSDYVKEAVTEISKGLKVEQTHLPVGVPMLPMTHEGINISFAGLVHESKGIGLVAKIAGIEDINIKVFGFGALGDSPLLNNLPTNVEVLYDLSDKEFQDYLKESDILVNYRVNYHGETSLGTLEAMRFGVVVLVNNVGWFAELPDDCVVKVNTETELIRAVNDLIKNPKERQKIGQAAKNFLHKEYSFDKYARVLTSKLEGR